MGVTVILTPEYLLKISEGSEEIAEYLHTNIVNRIIERMMIRIGRGETYMLTSYDKWQIEVLQEAGFLLEDIRKEIAHATKEEEKEIAAAFEDASVRAIQYDDEIYKRVGLSPVPLWESPYMVRLAQRTFETTMGEWVNFTATTAEASHHLFISAMDKAYNLVSSGAVSYTQAVKEALDEVVEKGVVVEYPTGHSDTIETATLRCVRTGIGQMSTEISMERMKEMGCNLVLVSSHMGARPSHAVWQGKVYSLDGVKYPELRSATQYGTVTGLAGANCRHNISPYYEGMENPFEKYDTEENKKNYEIEQRQRLLERRIRKTKRKVMNAKTEVDRCKDDLLRKSLDDDYKRKCALLQKQNEAYNQYCEENNLKRLSERLQIAKWDRAQAAAASGAARRYKNGKMGKV